MQTRLQLLRGDLKALVALSLPVALGQVGHMCFQLIDAAMIGQVGVTPLAAASFAGNLVHALLLFGVGLAMPIHILVSQAAGAGETHRQVSHLAAGCRIALLFSLVSVLLMFLARPLLYHLGQPVPVVDAAQHYFLYLLASVPVVLVAQCFKNFAEARSHPWLPFFCMLLGLACNVVLNWLFIYGKLGFPAMGLDGAGLATLLSRVLMLVILVLALCRWDYGNMSWLKPLFAKTVALKESFQLGLPAAFQVLFEAGAFIVAGILMGRLGETSLAAHHIVVTYAAVVFMVPLGISIATCIQIGEACGRSDPAAVRRIGLTNIGAATVFMAIFAAVTLLQREWIIGSFIDDAATIELAMRFIIIVGLFHIFDGIQVVAIGALRGMEDVRLPAIALLVAFWVFGLPTGYYLAFEQGQGGMGLWTGLFMGLTFAAIFLSWRFLYLCKRLRFGD